jgi:hypothetical protein
VAVITLAVTLLAFAPPAVAVTDFVLIPVVSERDLDQDGIPNSADTCPLDPGGPDTDGDGLADVCDPLDFVFVVDEDVDGVANAYDNCPLVANPGQADSEVAPAPDGGPIGDGIGDACDIGMVAIVQNGHALTVTLGPLVANGRYLLTTTTVVTCLAPGIDADGDGYCTVGGPTTDSAATDGGVGAPCLLTVPASCFVRHNIWTGAMHPALLMDTDGDTVTPTVGVISYFTDAVETYLTTDPTKPCAQTRTPTAGATNDESPLDNWPLDMDDNGLVNGADYLKYNTVLGVAAGGNRAVNVGGAGDGTATTPATIAVPLMGVQVQTRFDLNLDGFLSGADLGKFNAYFSKKCGDPGAPPLTVNNSGTFQQ